MTSRQVTSRQVTSRQVASRQVASRQAAGRQAAGRRAAAYKTACVAAAVLAALTACRHAPEDKERAAVAEAAEGFADKYFNYDLAGAAGLCTPESGKWIAFAASNVTQEDVDMLNAREESAECSAETVELTGDSTATAECRVENFLRPDTLGRPAEMTGEAVYAISLVKRNGRWLVKMEGLPQSGRRSRD